MVLVNNLPPENFEPLLVAFHDFNLRFVRGDYSREEILAKTNLSKARRVIILADRTDEDLPRDQVDQKTLLAALAVKSLHPKIRITAELIFPENRTHLERAHVDDIIIRGEYDSSLIASSTESEGLFKIMQSLLSPEGPNFWVVKIPPRFHGANGQSTLRLFCGKITRPCSSASTPKGIKSAWKNCCLRNPPPSMNLFTANSPKREKPICSAARKSSFKLIHRMITSSHPMKSPW